MIKLKLTPSNEGVVVQGEGRTLLQALFSLEQDLYNQCATSLIDDPFIDWNALIELLEMGISYSRRHHLDEENNFVIEITRDPDNPEPVVDDSSREPLTEFHS